MTMMMMMNCLSEMVDHHRPHFHPEQDLNLRRTRIQDLTNEVVQ